MTKKRIFSLFLVIMWMLVIFFMSNMNKDDSDNTSQGMAIKIIDKVDKITNAPQEIIEKHSTIEYIKGANHYLRKSAHFLSFSLLSLLVLNFLMQNNKKYYINNISNILFSFFYACTDEYHQTFIDGRGGQFIDVLIDTSGVIFGCIIFYLVYKIVMNKRKKQKIRNKNEILCRNA